MGVAKIPNEAPPTKLIWVSQGQLAIALPNFSFVCYFLYLLCVYCNVFHCVLYNITTYFV